MKTIREYKYKLIKNFFNDEELSILKLYCRERLNSDNLNLKDPDSPGAPSFYRDPLMLAMAKKKLFLVEKETGLKLFNTYSYWRYYMYGAALPTHRDRPACEISVTACVHKTKKWPIHMEGKWIEMEEGDAVVYLGHELEHGRNEFDGDACAQVFFHYVDQNGSHANEKDDVLYWKEN